MFNETALVDIDYFHDELEKLVIKCKQEEKHIRLNLLKWLGKNHQFISADQYKSLRERFELPPAH